MGKVSSDSQISVVKEALQVALGAGGLAALLYFIDTKTNITKQLDLVPQDVIMIGASALAFCFIWVLLAKWFFEPFLKLVEAREKLTVGAEAVWREKQNEADELTERYENMILEARTTAIKEKLNILNTAKSQAAAVVEKAQNEAQNMVKTARAELSKNREQLESNSSKEAEALSSMLVEKVISSQGALN